MKKYIFLISLIIFGGIAFGVEADTVGEKNNFYIDSEYDSSGRTELKAVLVKVTSKAYFYVDENWWNFVPQNEIYQNLGELEQEFEENIYPTLTSVFGSEWNPGIDKDSRITVLIHPMGKRAGGYFRSNDEYLKLQISDSNEREMVYLNSDYIASNLAKSFLAHEFVHLISFNQKENTDSVAEEVWLNEARAEYAPTLVGYDDEQGSNLQKRAEKFSKNPSDNLIEWQNQESDYGGISIFIHYLVDHYGIEILVDSLHSSKTGIDSINYALKKNDFEENLDDIFFDWTIASLINDCNYGEKYCYLDPNLVNFHVSSQINFLPLSGESTLTFSDFAREWTGNWYKIIGGKGDLKVSFTGNYKSEFLVPYITQNKAGAYRINFLELNSANNGEIYLEDFGEEIVSLYLIPSLKSGNDYSYFSWSASSISTKKENDQELINELLTIIAELKKEIARVQTKIVAMLNGPIISPPVPVSTCSKMTTNLNRGMNNQQVKCLQEFLKAQGADIYPEGLVTGFFGVLTERAVIRFQEKYASEILLPLGLNNGTGFVGSSTRNKIKDLF